MYPLRGGNKFSRACEHNRRINLGNMAAAFIKARLGNMLIFEPGGS